MTLMDWCKAKVDGWRRGPELRHTQALLAAAVRESDEAKRLCVAQQGTIRNQANDLRLIGALVRTLKARCAVCGHLNWHWEAYPRQGAGGGIALEPVCADCKRMLERRQKDAEAARAAASGNGSTLEA